MIFLGKRVRENTLSFFPKSQKCKPFLGAL